MRTRIPVSKKLRFEVLKRDSFKCQYCGAAAPDVKLHIDHLKPVSKGGDNVLLNLVTACMDCNHGKTNRLLDDATVVVKQRKHVEELSSKREDMLLIIEWYESTQKAEDELINRIFHYLLRELQQEVHPEDTELLDIIHFELRRLVRKYKLEFVLMAIAKYSIGYDHNHSIQKTFRAISSIADSLQNNKGPVNYCIGIIRNRLFFYDEKAARTTLEKFHKTGMPEDEIISICRSVTVWQDFVDVATKYFENPYRMYNEPTVESQQTDRT